MKISISSYSFHDLLKDGRMDVFGFLESCKYRYRVEAVEIWNPTFGNNTDEDFLRLLRASLDEHELVLANLCVDGPHVWEDDPADREAHHKEAFEYLKAAEILGAKAVRIDMGGKGLDQFTDEQYDYVVKCYKEYARRAGDNGFLVGPETHWGPSLTVAVQKRVHDMVDHPAYAPLLHVGHWNGGEEQENIGDKMLAPWSAHTHVPNKIVTDCLEQKMRLLMDNGYDGYWGVEYGAGDDEHRQVEWHLAEMRRMLARLNKEAK